VDVELEALERRQVESSVEVMWSSWRHRNEGCCGHNNGVDKRKLDQEK